MRLDVQTLEVQSFSTTSAVAEREIAPDTGQGGPNSYCWICYPTDETVPSCDYRCMQPDTFANPVCTVA